MTVSPSESGVVEAANFGRINVKYYPPSTTETCFAINESIDLTAIPNDGYVFSGWSISGGTVYDGSINSKEIAMPDLSTISTNVTAYFEKDSETILYNAEEIAPAEAKQLKDSNNPVIFIDVREADAFDAGHILCAQNRPWISGKFAEKYSDFTEFLNDEIIVYDKDGTISHEAASLLAENGFSAVYYMSGGLDNWQKTGNYTVTTSCDCEKCSLPPIAHAGADQTVYEGDMVTLNARTSSTVSSQIETYQWEQAGGDQTVILSDPASAAPTFTAPFVQQGGDQLIFHLTVTDIQNNQDTDSVTVFVNWFNDPPEADAGLDQTVYAGEAVILDGTRSMDQEGSIAGYSWSIDNSTAVVELSDSNTATPAFTAPDTSGWIRFLLTVTDSGGKTDTDSVTITIGASTNSPPEADAGADQTIDEGEKVQLDASESSDSDGSVKQYYWEQTSGPEVKLSNTYAVLPTFFAPDVDTATRLFFLLTVEDSDGAIDTDEMIVTINNINDCSWNAIKLDWECQENENSSSDETIDPEDADQNTPSQEESDEDDGGSSCFVSSIK